MAIAEITERINTERRHRTYPRVVKRQFIKYFKFKRPYHHGTRHLGPAELHIYNLGA